MAAQINKQTAQAPGSKNETQLKFKTMKKLFILSAIAFGGLIYTATDAQIRVGVNLGYHAQPGVYAQGPAVEATPAYGNSNDEYYYLPDLGVYYDVTDQCYFYFDGTEWVSSPYLPGQYANYDWRSARRFEIIGFRPYLHDDFYRERYNGNRFTGWGQGNYRDRDNNAYAERNFAQDNRNNYRQEGNRPYVNQDDNRVNRSFSQPATNREFNRTAQPYRPEGVRTDNRVTSQPSNQNRDRAAETRGGAEHFTQNRAQSTAANRKMSKF